MWSRFYFRRWKRYFVNGRTAETSLKRWKALGYQTLENPGELDAIQTGKVLAVWEDHDLPRPSVRKEMLTESTMKALELLSQNKKDSLPDGGSPRSTTWTDIGINSDPW